MRAVRLSVFALFAVALAFYLLGGKTGAVVLLIVGMLVEFFAWVTWFVTRDDTVSPGRGKKEDRPT